jgi:hypothetical protein
VRRVSVHNQFGRDVFRTGEVRALCVPTLKLPLP